MRRFDDQRVQDLQQVSYAVESFWNQNQHLPKTLDELMQGPPQYSGFSIQDPKTQVPYEYRILSASTYELCAVFETDAQTITAKTPQPMPAYAPPGFVQPPAFWQHGIGRTCFPVTVKKSP
jgi:hypothetical protein